MNRRDFVKATGGVAAVAAAANLNFIAGSAYAADGDKPLRLGLIGCGGRGQGALGDSLTANANVVVTAFADVQESAAQGAYNRFKAAWGDKGKFAAKPDAVYSGLNAYEQLCKNPEVDVVLHATPPGLRWLTFRCATENGKHSFVEKPVCVDAFTYNHVLETGRMADEKKLSVVCGLQYRRENSHIELIQRIHDGAIGEVVGAQSYYNGGIPWLLKDDKAGGGKPDSLEFQMVNWLHYVWLSGDSIPEQFIHSLDVAMWAMGKGNPARDPAAKRAVPERAFANGGRQEPIRSGLGDVFDSFAVDYIFENDVHLAFYGRQIPGADGKTGNKIIGTKGYATFSPNPGASRGALFLHGNATPVFVHDGSGNDKNSINAQAPNNQPYQQEHKDLVDAIRAGKPINDTQWVAESSFACVLGREAAYSGKFQDYAKLAKSDFKVSPDLVPGQIKPGTVVFPKGFDGVRVPGKFNPLVKPQPGHIQA